MRLFLAFAAAAAIACSPAASPAFAQTGSDIFDDGSDNPTLDDDFMVGRWTDDEDCNDAVEFAADGIYHTPEGTVGRWSLDGDRLTLTGSSTMTMRIVPVDDDTINVINPDGGEGRSTRCETPDDAIGTLPVIIT